ncbi:peptidylprolyl isomerase [Stratiformator vulcanicus]|uniref:Peptidyl-prolyl cis-trans isomerase D n=1 Tax=Stratiformator vulcanicus TaxID=2527980 RepID=A0A517R7C5_9PLAN|nr:peptidylprolyl isomerase [Stratiformator vulcanicus]QDT39790.1 Peptidyl-prolyl cis-trans isomerase D [Stratiformator vulcanicus]
MTASRRFIVICLLPVFSLGCEALRKSPNVRNPVVGPPPIRQSYVEVDPVGKAQYADASADAGEILTVSAESTELTEDSIVATVNAEPIIASDILAPYAKGFREAEAEMRVKAAKADQFSEEEINEAIAAQLQKIKKDLIRKDLDKHIERKLLTQALKNSMKPERLEAMEGAIDQVWQGELEKIQAKAGVSSRYELEPKLKEEQGMSLNELKDMFRRQQMAMAYLHTGVETVEKSIGRAEIVRYYEDHLDDYTLTRRARWQQIVILFSKAGGRDAALDQLRVVVDQLQSGTPFAEVAQKHSHGPRAERGGQWNWTEPGALSNDTWEQAIFNLPVGGVSDVIEDKSSFRLIRVSERDEGGTRSLTEVQDEIRDILAEEARKATTDEVIADLMKSASIETRIH